LGVVLLWPALSFAFLGAPLPVDPELPCIELLLELVPPEELIPRFSGVVALPLGGVPPLGPAVSFECFG